MTFALCRESWIHSAAIAMLGIVIPYFTYTWALTHMSSSLGSVFNGCTPLITLVVAVSFFGEEKLSVARVLGLFGGFAGLVAVIAPWQTNTTAPTLAIAACVLGSMSAGLGFVYSRRFLTGLPYSSLSLAAAQMLIAALFATIVSPLFIFHEVHVNVRVALYVLLLGSVLTGFQQLLYFDLVRDIGATRASLFIYLVPVFAVLEGASISLK